MLARNQRCWLLWRQAGLTSFPVRTRDALRRGQRGVRAVRAVYGGSAGAGGGAGLAAGGEAAGKAVIGDRWLAEQKRKINRGLPRINTDQFLFSLSV